METNLARLRSAPSPLRSAGVTTTGNPLFRGLGILFGGRDLYGDTFSPPREFLAGDDPDVKIGTDYFLRELADEVDVETKELRGALEVPVFWDHGLGVLGTKRLGKAVPTRITDEGIEYLIEIEKKRAQDYQAMIDELQMEGWLGLSSQTLPSFAAFDWGTGEIKSWFPAEMTLTVTPAEHRTRDGVEKVRSLFRKYGVNMAMKKTAEEQVQDNELVPADEEVTLSETMDSLFDDLTDEIAEEEEMVVQNEALALVLRTLNAFEQRLGQIDERLARMASAEDVQAVRDEVTASRTEYVEAARTMTTRLSEILGSVVRTKAAEMVQESSDFELQALRNVGAPAPRAAHTRVSGYALPPNAPGQN